jgi:glycine/D-amino acid oxidase-like deaminating enzyme
MAHRTIIVGAGIIGAAIAYYLSKKGAQVTIIEQSRPACGASSKSFGWINANFPDNSAYFQLRQSSIAEYHKLSNELVKPIGLKWGGSLWWEHTDIKFHQNLASLRSYRYPTSEILPKAFAELEPEFLKPPELCAKFPAEGAVDAIACSKAMINAAKANGATLLIGCEVTGLLLEKNKCAGVRTIFGDFPANTVVVSAGAAAQAFLAKSEIHLPMNNSHGLIVHTRAVKPMLDHLMITPDIHFRQHTNGSIVIGKDYGGGVIAAGSSPVLSANSLVNKLGQLLRNDQGFKVDEITMGKRPVPLDGYPVLGPPPNLGGLYIASLHSGVTLAPIVGKIAAKEILSKCAEPLFDAFRLSRF